MHAPRLYQLVCEGACSPDLAECDRLVTEIRAKEHARQWPPEALPDLLAVRLRAAGTVTPHRSVLFDRAICTVCGHERRYGKR